MVTSAAIGHRTGVSLALAYLTPGTETSRPRRCWFSADEIAARVLEVAPYDPDNDLPRDAPGA